MLSHGFVMLFVLLFCLLLQIATSEISLPPDGKVCHLSDPNFKSCIVKNGNYIIPQMVPGDPKYHIPKLNPLYVPEIVIDNNQLKIVLKEALFYGFGDAKLEDLSIDPKAKTGRLVLKIPKFNYVAETTTSGRILLLPIKGQGPANITLFDGTYDNTFHYTLTEKNGKQWAKLGESSGSFKINGAQIHLEGLFNGNKELTDQMNQVLNANWKDVLVEVGPAVNDAFREVLKENMNGILEKVSFDTLFPE